MRWWVWIVFGAFALVLPMAVQAISCSQDDCTCDAGDPNPSGGALCGHQLNSTTFPRCGVDLTCVTTSCPDPSMIGSDSCCQSNTGELWCSVRVTNSPKIFLRQSCTVDGKVRFTFDFDGNSLNFPAFKKVWPWENLEATSTDGRWPLEATITNVMTGAVRVTDNSASCDFSTGASCGFWGNDGSFTGGNPILRFTDVTPGNYTVEVRYNSWQLQEVEGDPAIVKTGAYFPKIRYTLQYGARTLGPGDVVQTMNCASGTVRTGQNSGRDWNNINEVSYAVKCMDQANRATCTDPDPEGKCCNTGSSGSCLGQQIIAATPEWSCLQESGDSVAARYLCDSANVGREFLAAGSARYTCIQTNCPTGDRYKFVSGRKTDATVCGPGNSNGVDSNCYCVVGNTTTRYFGGNDGPGGSGVYGTNWQTRVPFGSQLTVCNPSTHCTGTGTSWNGVPDMSDGCHLPGTVGTNPSWICAVPTGLPALYTCYPGQANKTISVGGQSRCCKYTGTPASPNGYEFVAGNDPACACPAGPEVCTDGCDNDGDTQIDCSDSDCSGNPACSAPCDPWCGTGSYSCDIITGDRQYCYWTSCAAGCNRVCEPRPCPAGYSCSGGSCVINCDQDGDGYRRMDQPGACGAGTDCNDTDFTINPGRAESIATNTCADYKDNNCNGLTDYDGFMSGNVAPATPAGDPGCPVSVTAASVTDHNTALACAQNSTITCTSSVGSVRSISASLGGAACSWTSWVGNQARFTCNLPATDGNHNARCYVNSYSTPGVPAELTDTCTVACRTNITGVVRDAKTTYPVYRANVSAEGTTYLTTTDTNGQYTLANVLLGTYTLLARADGYYDNRKYEFVVPSTPDPLTNINFNLDPEQCTPACTFRGVCDYSCIGQYGCELDVPSADRDQLMSICTGAANGTLREYNSTHMVDCCRGPIIPKSQYQAPLELKSCAKALIPHTTLVNYNGKLVQLTIVSYKKCE